MPGFGDSAAIEVRRSSAPPGPHRPDPAGVPQVEAAFERDRLLLCRACGVPVTAESEAVAVDGSAVHRRANPSGIVFVFGCFAAAEVLAAGEPTAEHSWFPGYTWVFALCGGCAEHLGWRFEGAGAPFYGLILDRLTPERPDRGLPS